MTGLLQPERAARLNEFHGRDPKYPDFAEIVARLVEETWQAPPKSRRPGQGDRAGRAKPGRPPLDGAGREAIPPAPRSAPWPPKALERLSNPMYPWPGHAVPGDAHQTAIRQEIDRFLRRPEATNRRTPTTTPPQATPSAGPPVERLPGVSVAPDTAGPPLGS